MATQDKNQPRRSSAPGTRSGEGRATASDTESLSRRGRDFPRARDWGPFGFGMLSPWRSWPDQMERFFNSFGLGAAGNRIGDWELWNPQVETFQRGDEIVIRADLPGLKKDDVNVEVTDDAVIIQGERRSDFEEDREGYYRSERSYGSFYRSIPLPEGSITENAKANFKDGVLEITMPAPPREVSRGRRIEISEGARGGATTTSAGGSTQLANEPVE